MFSAFREESESTFDVLEGLQDQVSIVSVLKVRTFGQQPRSTTYI
jgi:hypothetical protein